MAVWGKICYESISALTSGVSKTNNAFNQGFTSIVVLCYHAEIIASGLGWPDPILLHCTHQKTRQGLNHRNDKLLVSVLFTIKKVYEDGAGQDRAGWGCSV